MKVKSTFMKWINRVVIFIMAATYQSVALAQDKQVDVNINTKSDDWYAAPWVWVVGAAIFILLLVAILRGGSRRTDV